MVLPHIALSIAFCVEPLYRENEQILSVPRSFISNEAFVAIVCKPLINSDLCGWHSVCVSVGVPSAL